MNWRFMGGGIAIAATVLLQAALADQVDIPAYTPPRLIQRPDNFDDCRAQGAGDLTREFERSVKLTIAADGTLSKFALPEDSPDWLKNLSACAIDKLRFSPGTRGGSATESTASLVISYVARGNGKSTVITVGSAGPLITAPILLRGHQDTIGCYPVFVRRLGQVSRIAVILTVMPDGSVSDVTLPPGADPWQDKTVHCVLDRISFIAGTLDGSPVPAQATLPIVMSFESGKISAPDLRSSGEQIEAAYRACYPADELTMGTAYYSFGIATNGKVSNPRLIKGTGYPRLDDAGACILKMLEFAPLMQNGRAMRSQVTWELLIRPPR